MLMTILLLSEEYIMMKLDLIHKRLNLRFNKTSTLLKHI